MQNDFFKEKEEAWAIFRKEAAKIDAETRINVLAFNIYNDARIEYENLLKDIEEAKKIWDEFNKFKKETEAKISELYKLSAQEHSQMCESFALSKQARNEKKGFLADDYSKLGIGHREKRDAINEEINELKQEIFGAKKRAKSKVKYVDSTVLEDAKDLMDHWKKKYSEQNDKVEAIKKHCEDLRIEASKAQKRYENMKKPKDVDVVNRSYDTTLAHYNELKIEYEKILAEDAEIMKDLERCNKLEAHFRRDSDIFRRKVKKIWSLERANAK